MASFSISFISIILISCGSYAQECDVSIRPQVTLTQGDLQGTREHYRRGPLSSVCYESYKGIPYAQPPVGERIFKPALPAESWPGVLDATNDDVACIQSYPPTTYGSHDCLYLNVYVPAKNVSSVEPLSVMVYFHGGLFLFGSKAEMFYDPKYFLRKNVIIVTVNYRLGIYGFLGLETVDYPGNIGLKDQRQALQWVSDNIESFGGDPKKITIFGQSAGGISVDLHILSRSPINFQRAISQSGSVFADWGFKPNLRNHTLLVAKKLNCLSDNDEEIVKCLKNTPEFNVLNTASSIRFRGEIAYPLLRPTSEPPETPDVFFTGDPQQTMMDGDFHKVNYISGCNSAEDIILVEGYFDEYQAYYEGVQKCFPRIIPKGIQERYAKNNISIKTLSKNIKEFFYPNLSVSYRNFNVLVEIHGDFGFGLAGWESISRMAKANPNNNYYFYQFSFEGTFDSSKYITYPKGIPNLKGVSHAQEMPYLWYSDEFKSYPAGAKVIEIAMIDKMTSMWTNFAKTGIPTEDWTPINNGDISFYNINWTSRMEDETNSRFGKRLQFWKKNLNL